MFPLFFLTHPPQNNPDQASFFPFLFRGAEALSGVGHRDRPGRHPVSQNIRVHTTTKRCENSQRWHPILWRYALKDAHKEEKKKKSERRVWWRDTGSRGRGKSPAIAVHTTYCYNYTNHFWCRFGTYDLFSSFFSFLSIDMISNLENYTGI